MSRFAPIILAVLTAGSTALLAQAPPAPAAPVQVTPAAPLQVTPPGAAPAATPAQDPNALKWSAESIDYNAKPGEQSAPFTFIVTNVSDTEVSINSLRTSCGCTVAQLPTTPYKLAPGSNVPINVTMDLRGKSGSVTKTVSVDSSAGFKSLLVKVNMPSEPAPATTATPAASPAMDRAKNIQNALADRQAVFKGDCASCHVEKGKGKMGQELYAASCGICHDAEHRAAMVPDLKVPRTQRDLAFWQKWIMEGKPGTMMPAFAQIHGGPLTQEQIDSLTVYLFQNYPKAPKVVAANPNAAPAILSPSIIPPAPAVKN
jgi:mono/diheme cytochrome c family protein